MHFLRIRSGFTHKPPIFQHIFDALVFTIYEQQLTPTQAPHTTNLEQRLREQEVLTAHCLLAHPLISFEKLALTN